jgi:hypothetical protein
MVDASCPNLISSRLFLTGNYLSRVHIYGITLQDVQDYWQRYCQRHALKHEIMAQGQRFIARDHVYWADHPMQELKQTVVQHLKKQREAERMADRAD